MAADARPLVDLFDDDPVFLRLLAENLEAAGHATRRHTDPAAGLAVVLGGPMPALCVLDWDMPGLDGLALLRRLRAEGVAVPVLFLTGHSAPMFEEAALAAGAVDFIDKGRGPAVILRRMALALARRPTEAPAGSDLSLGELLLHRASRRARWRGAEVPLSRAEYDVVELLALRAGEDVPYRALYDVVRGEGFQAGQGVEGYRANVRAMVKRIRRKFEALDPGFGAIGSYPGVGYRWLRDA